MFVYTIDDIILGIILIISLIWILFNIITMLINYIKHKFKKKK